MLPVLQVRNFRKDGNTSYSSVIKINCGKLINSMQAYPVPAKNLLNVLI
jgi:hypothetical protein